MLSVSTSDFRRTAFAKSNHIGFTKHVVLSVIALTFGSLPALADDVETLKDKQAPGILQEETKDVLPLGLKLRPVYKKGVELTKTGEGWVPKRYNDAAGYCTVGYGHLLKKSKCDGTGNEVEFLNGISLKRGEELLIEDMASAQITVQLAAPKDLSDGQFASLVDFTFNVGGANFKGSTLLKVVKQKHFDRVPEQFLRWTKAGGKDLPGLKNRRNAEIKIFFDGQPIPKATPIPGEDLSPLDIDIGKGEAAK
ncbi:lysozyme [Rhizobium laguerreae]|uniref:lysozyme n=1 Tax=Rhizobium laguerreae TaxID=1076926 RepID=UPI001C92951A|nr:lysozyme [Rhizobium laguerreae]MBY3297650.1 lysozyme [Rhizobium laguerreae]